MLIPEEAIQLAPPRMLVAHLLTGFCNGLRQARRLRGHYNIARLWEEVRSRLYLHSRAEVLRVDVCRPLPLLPERPLDPLLYFIFVMRALRFKALRRRQAG